MTDDSVAAGASHLAHSTPQDDLIFDFDISDWIDPPVYVTTLPKTTPKSYIREMTEQEY